MATLEKIRSKSVLLIVVIGVALLAFIIGDAITNSRNIFGDQTTVAKIGGNKIDYTDYIRKREELNSQLEQARRQNPAQYANFDVQRLSQMALDNLVSEALLDQGAENAGIRTSGSQLSYYILTNPINPRISEIIQQLNMAGHGVSTPQQAYELIFFPKRSGLTEREMQPFQRAWVAMENETKQLVKRQTYQRLLMGTVKANNLDKKTLYNDYITTRNVDIAYHPYGKIDETKYEVDEAALNAGYREAKNRFKVTEPTKDVAFIAINITPSREDREAARQLADQTATALRDSAGQLNKDLKKEGIVVTRKELRANDLPRGAVKDFVTSAPADSVKIVTNNMKGFTIVKMGKRTEVIDSIQLNIVQVASPGLGDRVMSSLNSGLSLDSINNTYPADSVMTQKEQWIALYNAQGRTGALDQSQLDSLMNAGGKYITLMSTPQGALLAQMTQKNTPVALYEYEEVTYDLKPSAKTVNDERTRLEEFLTQNPSTKDFIANASKDNFNIQNASLTASSPALPRMGGQSFYPDSRQVVRWVIIDGQPGNVSHIYESKDAMAPALYAVAVVSEYDDFAPLANNEVNTYVTNKVRKSIVGDELMAKYQPSASSMETASQAMGVEYKNSENFRFGRNPQVRDASVMGRIAGSQPGKVVLIKGDDGIYAYQILSTGSEDFPYSERQYEQEYFQLVNPNLIDMLKGAKSYKNNIYKFEAGD